MAKDMNGVLIKEGQLAHVKLTDLWVVAKVKEIKPGGTVLQLSKENTAMQAGRVELEVKLTSPFDPRNPIVEDFYILQQPEVKSE